MNLAQLRAWLAAHERQVVIGGAGTAVAAGLYVRSRRTAGDAAAAASGDPTATAATTGGAGSQSFAGAAGGASYDSSSSDVYDALQPQIEQTQGLLGQVLQILGGGSSSSGSSGSGVTVNPTTWADKYQTPITVSPVRFHDPTAATTPVVTAPVHRLPAPAPTPTPAPTAYVVRSGDTLSGIASRFGVPGGWNALYNANRGVVGGNPNLIKPGQRLVVPR